jgi:hypothetical protein
VRYELKSRSFSETLDATFKLYRDHFRSLLSLGLLTLISQTISGEVLRSIKHVESWKHPSAQQLGLPLVEFLAAWLVALWVSCALASATTDAYLGKPFTFGRSVLGALARTDQLISTQFLFVGAVAVGFLLLLIPGVYLSLAWSVWIQVLVVEGKSGTSGLRRAREVTRGSLGRIGWLMLLFATIAIAFNFGAGAILPVSLSSLPWLGSALTYLPSALFAPLSPCMLTLIYFDGRIRNEAWDLEMKVAQVLPAAVGPDQAAAVP